MNHRIILFLLITLAGCSDSREYKIQFDDVKRLTVGDEIFVMGVYVGNIEDLTVDEGGKTLVTISVTKDIKVTEGSKFILQMGELGHQHIEIELANMDNERIKSGRLQMGEIRPMDTTGWRKITQEEYDSIIRMHPGAKLVDSIVSVLRTVYKDKKKDD